jgi:hypothetical protein
VQLRVSPFSVIWTAAVAEPSNVTTSRRLVLLGVCPWYVADTCMERMRVPAIGYPVESVVLGMPRQPK